MPGILDNITKPEIDQIDLPSLLNTKVFNNTSNSSNIGKGFGTLSDVPNVNVQQGYLESRLKPVSGYDAFESTREFNPDAEDMDNIRSYAVGQGTGEYAYNLGAKFLKTTWNSFAEGIKQNGRNIAALTSWDAQKLYNNDSAFTSQMEEDRYALPTFGTGENDNSGWKYNPFTMGKADFYGEMIPQLGFTIGTMGEAILENMLIVGLTGGLGEAAMVEKNAWTAAQLGKGFKNLWESANGIKNLRKGLSSLSAISKEKNLGYNLAQVGKSIANGYAMYNTAAGEASFEAGNNYNETKDQMIQEFTQKNGYKPFGDDIDKIEKAAKSAAITTFGWNLPVLMVSNLVQFNNIIKPFKSGEAALLEDVVIGLNRTEKKLEIVKKAASKWDKVRWVGKGILEPISEGLEETTQSIISKTSSDYYKNIEDASNPSSQLWDSLQKSFEYAKSSEGFDEFMGGFIGGALFKGVGKINEKLGITSKFGFQTNKDRKKRKELLQEQAIEVLNKTSARDIFNYLQEPDNANLIAQTGHSDKMQKAVREGSRLDYNDAKDASVRDFIYAGLKTGKLEVKLSSLDLLNEMTDEQIVREYNIKSSNEEEKALKVQEKRQELQTQVQAIKDKAYSLQDEYTAVEKKYGNKYQIGTDEYNAWEEAKKARVFSRDAVESDRNRSNSIKDKVQTKTEGRITSRMLDIALDQNLRDQYIKTLEPYSKIPIKDQTPEMKNKVKEYNMFIYIDDMLKNTSVTKKGVANRIAQSLYTLNTNHPNDLTSIIDTQEKQTLVNDIEDVLKIETRNRKNIEVYNYLNGKGFIKEFEEHLKAQQALEKAIEANRTKTVAPASGLTSEDLIKDLRARGYIVTLEGGKISVKKGGLKVTYKDEEEFKKNAPEKFKEVRVEPPVLFSGQTPNFDSEQDEAMSKGPAAKIVTEAGLTDSSKFAEQSAKDVNPLDPNYHRRKDSFLEKLQEGTLINPDTKAAWNPKEVITLIVSKKNKDKYFKDSENTTNIFNGTDETDTTPIVFIFVKKVKDQYFPISVDGTLSATPLSQEYEVKFDNIVYSYATTSTEKKFTYNGRDTSSDLRPVPGTKEEDAIKQYKDAETAHRARREKWINSENAVESPFIISQGLSNRIKGQEYARNGVEEVGLTAKPSNNDILILTTGGDKDGFSKPITLINGTKRVLKIGRPYFVTKNGAGEVISYTHLDNRRFTESEKETIKTILLYLSQKVAKGDKIEDTLQYKYLKGIMFMGKEGLSLDTSNKEFKVIFDNKTLSLVEGSNMDAFSEFDTWIATQYMNIAVVNAKDKEFTEFSVKNGKLKDKQWKDYGAYLLTKRENTPLTVDILTPEQVNETYEDGNPYPTKRKQHYIILGSERVTDSGKKLSRAQQIIQDKKNGVTPTSQEVKPESPAQRIIRQKREAKEQTDTSAEDSTPKPLSRAQQIIAEKKAKAAQVTEIKEETPIPVTSPELADIERRNTFTRKSQMKILAKGTPIFGGKVADGKTEFLDTELGFRAGDRITFFSEKQRRGIWNGTSIIESGTNNPWGLSGILMSTNDWVRNQTKYDAELKALGQQTTTSNQSEIKADKKADIEKRRQELGLQNVIQVYYPTQSEPRYQVTVKGEKQEFLAFFDKGMWNVLPKAKEEGRYVFDKGITPEKAKETVYKYLPKDLINLFEDTENQNTIDKQQAFDKGPISEYIALYRKEYLQERIPAEEEVLEYYKTRIPPNGKESNDSVIKMQIDSLNKLKEELAALEIKTEVKKPAGLLSGLDRNRRAPKGRTKLQEQVTNYTPENIEEIKEFFKKNLPQVSLEFVPELIKLADGNLAWGVFYDSTVQVFEKAQGGTGYHEAFEVVFGGILNRKQQNALLSQMRSRTGTFKNFATDGLMKYSEANDSQLREEMAEEFMRFKLTGVVKEDNRNFFQKLLDFIKSFVFGIDRVNEVFTKLNKGYYSQKTLTPLSETRTSKFTNLSPLDTLKYLKSFSYEIVDNIVSATSFNRFDGKFNQEEQFNNLFEMADNFYNSSDVYDETSYIHIAASKLGYIKDEINANNDLNDKEKENKINNEEILLEQDLLKKQDTWNNKIKPQWNQFVKEQLKYLKQIGIIKTVEDFDDSEVEQEEKTNEYTKDAFIIDVKQTAPNSIRLAFNTIAQSVFDFGNVSTLIEGDVELPNIVNKVDEFTGLSTIYNDSKELFNTVITGLAGSLTLEQMKSKLEELIELPRLRAITDATLRSKEVEKLSANPMYVHMFKLYQRVFGRQELTEDDVAFRLKFLSTFQKQKPVQYFLSIGEDGNTFLLDGSRDTGRRALLEYWSKNLTRWQKSKDNKNKIASRPFSKSAFSPKTLAIAKLIELQSLNELEFIKEASKELGITLKKDVFIDNDFLDSINNEQVGVLSTALRTILEVGFIKNMKAGKVRGTITPAKLGVSASYSKIADLLIAKTGDNTEQVMSNIEGEQQQLVIQNNTVSTTISEINSVSSKEELFTKFPWFKDNYVKNSVRLNQIFEGNKVRVVTVQGTQDKNPSKSSSQGLSERLMQEFSTNLAGVYYILVPADSETEWAIEGDQIFQYSSDLIEQDSKIEVFRNYLKDEINFAKDFLDESKLKRKDERLNRMASVFGGAEQRKIGASLQLFKDILSEDVVSAIHKNIDEGFSAEDIIESLENDITEDIQNYFQNRITETFKALNKARLVDVVNPKNEGTMFPESIIDTQYYFHGLLSDFTNGRFEQAKPVKSGKNTVKFKNTVTVSKSELENIIMFREMNYVANNIEATKLFFGNPSYYKDILKRVKSGLSPKQNSATEEDYDHWFTNNLNQGLEKDHLYYHEFKPYVNTWVFKDHSTFNNLKNYSANNAVDAQSQMTAKAYREFYWKNGASFRPKQEETYQIVTALDRRLMDEDGVYEYPNRELKAKDDALLKEYVNEKNEFIKELPDVFEIFKPLGMGQLYSDEQMPFIWKTSVGMMTYNSVRKTPMQSVYIQMLNNNIDVLTFESAWKVGLKTNEGKLDNLLNLEDFNQLGKANTLDSFVHRMPFNYLGRQVETSGQKNKGTIGTQTTKLALTDLFQYGIPSDFQVEEKNFQKKMQDWYALNEEQKVQTSNHYRLEKKHRREIEALENKGYYSLLNRLGLKELPNKTFESYDPQKVYDLLIEEMVKRGLSPNIYEMLEEGVEISDKPLEALSNYSQASFIIMSLVRKSIIRPKLNGGQKIQMSSALMNKSKLDFYYVESRDESNSPVWKKIEGEEEFNNLTPDQRKTLTPTSNQLKFYSQNEDKTTNAMEVFISYSNFQNVQQYREKKELPPISKEELLAYINKNQKELTKAIGFRIPTQALSSIDTFIIKGFLPEWMGDAIAVPSELTTKSGSDFDVDKLNTYLNNYYISGNGYPKYITPDLEISEQANERRWVKYAKKKKALQLIDNSIKELTKDRELSDRNAEAFFVSILDSIDTSDNIEDILEDIDSYNEEVMTRVLEGNGMNLYQYNTLRDEVNNLMTEEDFKAQDVYLQNSIGAVENAYFSTVDEILKLERNFDRLLSPNTSEEFAKKGGIKDNLKTLTETGEKKAPSYVNHAAILDSNYMRYQRWAFVSGKKGVGIAALSSTNHVNSQKIGFKLQKGLAKYDFSYNLDGQTDFGLHLPHNQVVIDGEKVSVLSGIEKLDGKNIGEYVSKYVNGYVDISKDTWILEMGATLDVAGIFLLMERLGVDSQKIVLFMNQPVVRNFIDLKVLKNSSIRRINPLLSLQLKGLSNDDTLFEYIKKEIWPKGAPKNVDEWFEGDFESNNMRSAITDRSKYASTAAYFRAQDEATKLEQYRILKQFMILAEQSNYIRTSQQGSNHDTFNLSNMSQMDVKEEILAKSAENPLVTTINGNIPMGYALVQDTFVGNIMDKLRSLDNNFISNIFKIQNRNVRTKVLDAIKTLRPDYNFISENDKRDLANKINQVVLNYLNAQTSLSDGSKLQDWFLKEEIIKDKDDNDINIGSQLSEVRLSELLKNTREAIKDSAEFKDNKWLSYLTVEKPDEESAYGYFSLNKDGRPGRKDTAEHLIWLDNFERLYENAATQKLAKYILLSSMLTSGAEFNRENMSDFIPWKHYFKYFSRALENAEVEIDRMNIPREIARLKAFDTDLVPTLQYFGKGDGVTATAFTKVGNEYLPIINSKEKEEFEYRAAESTNTIIIPYSQDILDTIVLIPVGSYDARNNYFTVKQPRAGYTQQEVYDMQKEKDYSWQTTILFENQKRTVTLPRGEYNVFIPIQVKGDRYFQEISNVPYSILEKNQKVNSELEDITYLEEQLKKLGKVSREVIPIDENAVSLQPMQQELFKQVVNEFTQADKLTPIEQNFKDGQGGRQMQDEYKGKSTMELIQEGIRTRTTRSNTEVTRMVKEYNLAKFSDLVGKVIRMTDKEGNEVYTRITGIHKFTKEYQDATWQQEGWKKEVTDKLLGQYPYAIEFEVASLPIQKATNPLPSTKEALSMFGYSDTININNSTKKSPYFEKDKKKFASANKLIAKGSKNSSTEAYRIAVGDKANTSNYTSSDIVAISAEGKREGRFSPDFNEIQKAIDANVIFITDTKSDRNREYNIGEREIADYLTSKGYFESKDGIWTNSTKQPKELQINEPLGEKVMDGVYVNKSALSKEDQLELFEYLKPFIESQGKKTNKGAKAPIMIGLGLRWDYKSNNPNKTPVDVGMNLAGGNTSYAYYDTSINGYSLGEISDRFVELMNKVTGVSISDYDGAIINVYQNGSFIGNHSDLEESATSIKYPVVVANIGGEGNIILGNNSNAKRIELPAGSGYLFGFEGKNRKIQHSTYANDVKGFLPDLKIDLENKTLKEGEYRVSITMRRVMPLNNLSETPTIISVKGRPDIKPTC